MRLRTVSRAASRCKLRQSATRLSELKRGSRGAVANKEQTATAAMAGKQAILTPVDHEGQAVAAPMTGEQTVTILVALARERSVREVALPVCLLEDGLEARRPDCQKEGELTVCMINAYTHRSTSGSATQADYRALQRCQPTVSKL